MVSGEQESLRANQQAFLAREAYNLYHRRLIGAAIATSIIIILGAGLLAYQAIIVLWQAGGLAVVGALLGAIGYFGGRATLGAFVSKRYGVTDIRAR